MIELAAHADGCRTCAAVRGQPGKPRNGVAGGRKHGALKVRRLPSPADCVGRANMALAEVLADALGLKKSQVELLAGPTSRDKRFLLRGVTTEQMRQRLQAVLDGDV